MCSRHTGYVRTLFQKKGIHALKSLKTDLRAVHNLNHTLKKKIYIIDTSKQNKTKKTKNAKR